MPVLGLYKACFRVTTQCGHSVRAYSGVT